MKISLATATALIQILGIISEEDVGCPFLRSGNRNLHGSHHHTTLQPAAGFPGPEIHEAYGEALTKIDWKGVRKDLRMLFRSSHEEWPADYGHYGGLFVRLAWHCSGSYRQSDGRGGCDGGNQRFDPERSWADNTNLDKARKLLGPIKAKYGLGLSWGDLFVLAGTEAISDMGGPVLGFCAGRIDTVDNGQTVLLGPTPEQDDFAHCETDGDCKLPLGTNTLGLIYVNPEGPMGIPDPLGAANTIRDVFGRMGMGNRDNVALIGGGHTFGKSHGACPDGPGLPPSEDEGNPWPGMCGSGRGSDTFTSGFEGAWTANPTKWDNSYMRYLIDHEWEAHIGPGGHYQWRVMGDNSPKAPIAYPPGTNRTQDVMMLTTDVALKADPIYRQYVEEFANDENAFAEAFAKVWFELTTRDMGPASRCTSDDVPSPQSFQHPLPEPPKKVSNMDKVEKALMKMMKQNGNGEFVRLAWQCASTFRITDYHGGCNGARIRFSPGKDWETNDGLGDTLALLQPIKDQFGDGLSWSDLIVLAGNVAIAHGGGPSMPFCPKRTDASDGDGWKPIAFGNDKYPKTVNGLIEINSRRGLTNKELVALSWASIPNAKVRTKYLREIVEAETCDGVLPCGLKNHPELRVWTEFYVEAGDEVFMRDAALAWTKMMNADRFDGPVGSACHKSSSENIIIPLEALSSKATGSPNSTESIPFQSPPIFSSSISIFVVLLFGTWIARRDKIKRLRTYTRVTDA